MRAGGWMRATLAAVLVAVALPVGLEGQAVEESRLLREAAARESRGDFTGAERVLRRLLEARPTSSGGLFALERVLRARGQPGALLPAVDTFLVREPRSSGVRYLKLRLLAELDSLDALKRAAEEWYEVEPGSGVPYREVSRIYERVFGAEEALKVLQRGRTAAGGDGDVLAMEMGDLLAASGRIAEAVEEWTRAVGPDGSRASAVARRLAGLPEGRREAARPLVQALGASPEPARRRAGAEIALTLGMEDEALALSRRVTDDLSGRARASFLSDAARRARDGDMDRVASWAYAALGEEARSPAERRQFDARLVEVSLAAGDTAAALEAQRRIADSHGTGTPDRRQALARVIRLEGSRAGPDRLRALLDDFREEFPGAPELDDLAATVAQGLQARGDEEAASAVLEGVEGPRSAEAFAYLLLDAGSVEAGREALLRSVRGLPPAQATEVIQFAGLLQRLSPPAGAVLARAGVLAHRGRAPEAAEHVVQALDSLPEEERATLLAEAARLADRGDADGIAAELRARIVAEHPEAPERAEAALDLARYRARVPDGLEEAIRLLEDLITDRPGAAVVPDARRELERLRQRRRG